MNLRATPWGGWTCDSSRMGLFFASLLYSALNVESVERRKRAGAARKTSILATRRIQSLGSVSSVLKCYPGGGKLLAEMGKVCLDCENHSRRQTCHSSGLRDCMGSVSPARRF